MFLLSAPPVVFVVYWEGHNDYVLTLSSVLSAGNEFGK